MSEADDSAAIVKTSSVSAELVTNDRWPEPNPIIYSSTFAIEHLEHDRYGESVIAETYAVSREFIHHERYGESLLAETYFGSSETIVSDRFAVPIHNEAGTLIIEMLISESPFKSYSSCIEFLQDRPNDPITVSHNTIGYTQTAITRGNPWPDPATVWSWTHVSGIAQQTVAAIKPTWPHSPIDVGVTNELAVTKRVVTPVAEMISQSPVKGYRQLAVVSKSMKTVSISAVFAKGLKHQTLTARVTDRPDTLQGSIFVNQMRSFAVHSRGAMPFAVDVIGGKVAQQAVTARPKAKPISENRVHKLVQHAIVRRIMPQYADMRSTLLKQTTIVKSDTKDTPRSSEYAKLATQQAIMQVRPVKPISYNTVGAFRGYTVQQRWMPLPGFLLGWRIPSVREYAVVETKRERNWSALLLGSMCTTFMLRRDVPAPIDVIDPSIGRHVNSLVRAALVIRPTQSPVELVAQSRYVSNVLESYVLQEPADALPPPPAEEPAPPVDYTAFMAGQLSVIGDHAGWAAVSALRIQMAAEALVVGDESWPWLDPLVPLSDIDANLIYQPVVAEDEFLPSWAPQSDAEVALLVEQVALGDESLPGTHLARADAEVAAVIEQVALEDHSMPPSDTVLSEAIVSRVTQTPIYGDHTLRTLPLSPTTLNALAELVVHSDPLLMRFPRRQAGARPIVTIVTS